MTAANDYYGPAYCEAYIYAWDFPNSSYNPFVREDEIRSLEGYWDGISCAVHFGFAD
jgi:hypothetical protein